MTINELIAECEILQKPLLSDPSHGVGFRSWKLLPLLVKVIKNQQRQIETLKPLIEEVHDLDSGEQDCIAKDCGTALRTIRAIAAELEDVKPC